MRILLFTIILLFVGLATQAQSSQALLVCDISDGKQSEILRLDVNQEYADAEKEWGPWKISLEFIQDYGASITLTVMNVETGKSPMEDATIWLTDEAGNVVHQASDFKINRTLKEDNYQVQITCDTAALK